MVRGGREAAAAGVRWALTLREAGREGFTPGMGQGRTLLTPESRKAVFLPDTPDPRSGPLFRRKAGVPISKRGKGLLRFTRAGSSEFEALRGQLRAQGTRASPRASVSNSPVPLL